MAPYLAGPAPCFLTGDFNAPSHLDYADFPWPTSLAPYAAGLRDAYRDMHPDLTTYFQLQQSPTEPPWDWADADLPTTNAQALLEAGLTACFYRILAR